MRWPTCCNFSQALLCCGNISLCRRLGVSQQLCPLGCSLSSLTLCLRLARGKSPSLSFLAFSTKPTEELHPCILTLLNVAINSALFAARSSYLHRLFQSNFCTNPILIQPEYWQQDFLFLGLQEWCQKKLSTISEKRNGLMLEAWSQKGWLHWVERKKKQNLVLFSTAQSWGSCLLDLNPLISQFLCKILCVETITIMISISFCWPKSQGRLGLTQNNLLEPHVPIVLS